jgi:hypothetical protein
MSDHFATPNWTQNTEVIWNEDLTQPLGFIVNGQSMTPEEFERDYMLKIHQEISHQFKVIGNQQILEDLFVTIQELKAKILSKHCNY